MDTYIRYFQFPQRLPKFEPLPPSKLFYINHNTSIHLVDDLIHFVQQIREFILLTKYDSIIYEPSLLQIAFRKEHQTYVVFIEMRYLPGRDGVLFQRIQTLLGFILYPSNFVQSWGDIQMELKHFLVYDLFSMSQINEMKSVNIQQKFKRWFEKTFEHSNDCNDMYDDMNDQSYCLCAYRPLKHTYNEWSLTMALTFTFQLFFNTSLIHSKWNVGLYLQSELDSSAATTLNHSTDNQKRDQKKLREILNEFAIHECLAVDKFVTLFQNASLRKHIEESLKNYYINN